MGEDLDRPGEALLDEAIEAAISKALKEWDLTVYEVVGVLTVMAARIAHKAIDHDE